MLSLHSLSLLSSARSRSISAENVNGGVGAGGMADIDGKPQKEALALGQDWGPTGGNAARELGQKYKVRPSLTLLPGRTTTLMDIDGPGCIRHIWMTTESSRFRELILRMYWDGEATPSVEVPLGDFFCNAAKHEAKIMAIPINVNPVNGMNSYFPMPFARHAKITVENIHPDKQAEHFYYYIDYDLLDEIPAESAYFHATFRRVNPLPYGEDFTILDGVSGRGHFVGCYLTYQQNNDGWWGEGEVKIFIDGDDEFPTICGTGTEDYFGGAWCFGETFSAPFMGYPFGGKNAAG
ncbi:MAG: DUF2961 domain-containing protein, partial [Victivallales bacterium]|nr:DUF2961 domain-containing protein [Victivallales bacterium]